MKRLAFAAAAAVLSLAPAVASAGVYTDDMTKCLVRSSSDADNKAFVQWVFAALSANPAVKPLTVVNEAQRAQYAKASVGIMERLLTQDCRKETVMALKVEGQSAIEGSFNVVGQVAFRSLLSDPATMAEFVRLGGYADKAKWEALAKEAGVPSAPAAPPPKK